MGHHAPISGNIAGNDRAPRRHRLQEHDAKALPRDRWRAEDITTRVVTREILCRDEANEVHVANAVALHQVLEFVCVASARDNETGIGKLLVDEWHGSQQVLETLARFIEST